jgi:hypothetical protein
MRKLAHEALAFDLTKLITKRRLLVNSLLGMNFQSSTSLLFDEISLLHCALFVGLDVSFIAGNNDLNRNIFLHQYLQFL